MHRLFFTILLFFMTATIFSYEKIDTIASVENLPGVNADVLDFEEGADSVSEDSGDTEESENSDNEYRFRGYKKIETEHFTIIYEPEDRDAAIETYNCCEDIYDSLSEFFQVEPEHTKIVIRGRIDTANGSYYPIPEHINLYVTSPSDFSIGSRSKNWIRGLLTHEMSHYFHIGYEEGFFHVVSKIFGKGVKPAPSAFEPGWMMEGITTNTETIFTEGGRGRNAFFEMFYKAPVVEQGLFSIKQASYSSNFQPYGRIYVAGYILVEHLLRVYGDDAFTRIHRQVLKNPFAPDKAVKFVTGKSSAEIFEDVKAELLQRYRSNIDMNVADKVTPFRESSWYRPFINGTEWVVYRHDPDRGSAIVRYDSITGVEKVIRKVSLTDRNSLDIDFSGNKALFTSLVVDYSHPAGTEYVSELFLMNLANGKINQIGADLHLRHPVFLADNKAIAVQEQGSYSRLVIVDLLSSEIQPVYEEKQISVFNPAVSPDGYNVVFTVNKRGKQKLFLYNVVDGEVRQLTAGNKSCEYYSRFVSNSRFIFSSDIAGELSLFEYDLNSDSVRVLCRDRIGAWDGIKDNEYLYYNSYGAKGYNIKKIVYPANNLNLKDVSEGYPLPEVYEGEDLFPPVIVFTQPEEETYYADAPDFIAWAPVPFNYNSYKSFPDEAGIGFALFSQSTVNSTYLQFIASNPYNNFQPNIYLDVRTRLWRFPLSFSFKNVYMPISENGGTSISYMQLVNPKLSIDFPVIDKSIAGNRFYFGFKTGLEYLYTMKKDSPFMMFDVPDFNYGDLEQEHNLYLRNGIDFLFSQSSSMRNLFPGNYLYVSGSTITAMPVAGNSVKVKGLTGAKGYVATFPKQSLFYNVDIGYSNYQDVTYSFGAPGFSSSAHTQRGKLAFSLGYAFNIADFDLPLFWSLNWQGIGAKLTVTGQSFFDTGNSEFYFDPYLYMGLEIVNLIGFTQAVFPLSAGVAIRVDTSGTNAFNASRDIAPIFSFDFSQFIGNTNKRFTEKAKFRDERIDYLSDY